jgi:ABC-type sugar transport system ATPase subunit
MAAYQYIYVMKGLGKTFPGGREVLKDIWLSFLPGAKIGVLGPNGAGKSTLLRIMAGEERDFAGEAWAAEGLSRRAFYPLTMPLTVGPGCVSVAVAVGANHPSGGARL